MKLCVICKTPIETGLEVMTETGPVHMGQCKQYHDEITSRIQENEIDEDLIEESQLLM